MLIEVMMFSRGVPDTRKERHAELRLRFAAACWMPRRAFGCVAVRRAQQRRFMRIMLRVVTYCRLLTRLRCMAVRRQLSDSSMHGAIERGDMRAPHRARSPACLRAASSRRRLSFATALLPTRAMLTPRSSL